ncbi:uncharacterized protein [Asterias amurensis]|uniref:uncharacterized protein n=1 Tax=Asterias amurensis TaxID=7602 RepID=UPI003AB33310
MANAISQTNKASGSTSSSTTSRGPRNNQCPLCKKNVQKGVQALQCEYCSVWHHISCESISEEEYNFLTKRGQQLHWFCKACNAKAVDVLILVHSMKDQQDEMKAEISQLSDKVGELVKIDEPTFKKNIKAIVREEIYEAKERDLRKNNLVITGLKEIPEEEGNSDASSDEEDLTNTGPSTSDKHTVEHLIHTVLGLKNVVVISAERLPRVRIPDHRRLVIASVATKDMKHQVLRVSKKLSEKKGWKDVFIGPDRTRKEREEDKTLRDELRGRRESGEMNLVIKKGQIISLEGEAQLPRNADQESSNKAHTSKFRDAPPLSMITRGIRQSSQRTSQARPLRGK